MFYSIKTWNFFSFLKNHLISHVCSNLLLYTEQSKLNPSILAFEQELENILLKFAKRNSTGDGYQVRDITGKRLTIIGILYNRQFAL